MNTGIGDAINLAWKLAAVLEGQAPDALLDSYEAERLPFARRLVDTTDRVFSLVTAEGPVAEVVRTGLVPRIMPLLARFPAARTYFFRTISQTVLHYRHAPLNAGHAGQVRGGDRLPWVRFEDGDNYAPPARQGKDGLRAAPGWQVHVYGSARTDLVTWCALHGVALRRYDWQESCAQAGLARDAAYLLRPDSYVGLAAGTPAVELLDDYLRANGITL
jgi:hypothetical protein